MLYLRPIQEYSLVFNNIISHPPHKNYREKLQIRIVKIRMVGVR